MTLNQIINKWTSGLVKEFSYTDWILNTRSNFTDCVEAYVTEGAD